MPLYKKQTWYCILARVLHTHIPKDCRRSMWAMTAVWMPEWGQNPTPVRGFNIAEVTLTPWWEAKNLRQGQPSPTWHTAPHGPLGQVTVLCLFADIWLQSCLFRSVSVGYDMIWAKHVVWCQNGNVWQCMDCPQWQEDDDFFGNWTTLTHADESLQPVQPDLPQRASNRDKNAYCRTKYNSMQST